MTKNITQPLADSYVKSSVIFVVLSLVSAVINYLYYPMIARLLSLEEFGETQALIALLLQISAVFSGLSLVTVYIVRKLPIASVKHVIEILQKCTVFLFVALTAFLVFFYAPIAHFLQINNAYYLLLVGGCLITNIPFIIAFGYLQAEKHFISAGTLQVSVVTTKLLVGGFLTYEFGAAGALSGIIVGQIIGMVLFYIAAPLVSLPLWSHRILSSLTPPTIRELLSIKKYLKEISAIFITNVLLSLYISIGIIAARHYFNAATSGLFAGAATLSTAIVFACLPLISVLLPHLDMQNARDSKKPFLKTLFMVLIVCIGATAIFTLVPSFMLSLLGPSYDDIAHLLWRFAVMFSLISVVTLILQVNAFYRPLQTGFLACLTLPVLLVGIMHGHETVTMLISTITIIFGSILCISLLQGIKIYHDKKPNN